MNVKGMYKIMLTPRIRLKLFKDLVYDFAVRKTHGKMALVIRIKTRITKLKRAHNALV